MNEAMGNSEAGSAHQGATGLSQVQRIVDTFVAPTATFRDILRSAACWLPFLLIVIVSTGSTYTIDRNVGYSRVAENQVHASPKAEERMSELAPADRASQMEKRTMATRYFSYAFPIFLLLFLAIYAGIMLGTINFGLGARMTYGQSLAVTIYASLPYLVISLLTILTVAFGNNAETFNIQNPVGTNLAYYLPDAAPWLKALLAQFDLVKLWSLGLTILGFKIVAKKSTGQIVAVVIGWWMLGLLVSVAVAAISS
ncbi:MAG TPA: YIP1 family protein [Acidobacteriaceae bacterium]|nr:YIP1 family protein [Acidobacteriaceae bacterium]